MCSNKSIASKVYVAKYNMGLLESWLQINVRLHDISVEAGWMVNHSGETERKMDARGDV